MDLLAALRQGEAMLDLADRANELARQRRRALRGVRFHIEQEFAVSVDSLLIGTPVYCKDHDVFDCWFAHSKSER